MSSTKTYLHPRGFFWWYATIYQPSVNFGMKKTHDFNSGFYNYDISWAARDDRRYYSTWIFRDHLQYFHLPLFHMLLILLFMAPHFLVISRLIFSVNLNGKILYNSKKNYGKYQIFHEINFVWIQFFIWLWCHFFE